MNDLRASLIEMYRTALEACTTEDEVMAIHREVGELRLQFGDIQHDAVGRAWCLRQSALAREGQHE